MISTQGPKRLAAAAVAAALLAGAGAASAQTATTKAPKAPKSKEGKAKDGANRTPETPLTGAIADQVKAAALAAVPGGTVVRVENDNNDGAVYEAHVTKADGTAVKVTFDANVKVIAITADKGEGRGGKDGGKDRGRGNEAPLTGAIADQVKAAALAAVPGGTVIRVEADDHGAAYEAHVTKADGTEVEVTFDANVKVIEVKERGGKGGRGGMGGGRHGRRDSATTVAK